MASNQDPMIPQYDSFSLLKTPVFSTNSLTSTDSYCRGFFCQAGTGGQENADSANGCGMCSDCLCSVSSLIPVLYPFVASVTRLFC